MSDTVPDRRREGRHRVLMSGRCHLAPGQSPEVWLTQISVWGCQITVREGLLAADQHVVIKTGAIEGLPGIVRWTLGELAGIEFAQPLDEGVLADLADGGPACAARTPGELVDQFGRRMPNWPRTPQSSRRD